MGKVLNSVFHGALLAALIVFGACKQDVKLGKTVRLAFAEEPPTLNHLLVTDQVSNRVLGHVMEGLTRYDHKNRIIPAVAEKWDLEEKKATFYLRKDAKWSDGKAVTAHDFVFSWRKVLEPKTASQYSFIFYPIKNAQKINTGKLSSDQLAVKALDDYTLEVHLEQPCPYFLALTAFSTFLPLREDFYKDRGSRYAAEASDLLFNGPFKLTEWKHMASLKMEKNESYWNKAAVNIDVIDVPYITPDNRSRFNLFKDNKIDFVELNTETIDEAVKGKHRFKKFAEGTLFYMQFNFAKGRVTANKNLRKAIKLVFDPVTFVNRVESVPGNLPGISIIPTTLKGVSGRFREEFPMPVPKPDLALAKKHMALALKELGLSKAPSIHWLTGDNPTSDKQSQFIQGLLKKTLGIELKIDKQIFKQRIAKMHAKDFDIVAAGWGPDYDDVMTFADLFTSWNENNHGRYKNAEYDQIIREASATLDAKKRMVLFDRIQKIVDRDIVALPMYERGKVYLTSPRIKGIVRNPVGSDPSFIFAKIVE